MVISSNSNTFCDWRKTCHGSKLTDSLGKQQLARDQVVLLETEANLCASQRQANDLLRSIYISIFELGGITKNLMTRPAGNSEFCFPQLRVSGKQNSRSPLGPYIKCLLFDTDISESEHGCLYQE